MKYNKFGHSERFDPESPKQGIVHRLVGRALARRPVGSSLACIRDFPLRARLGIAVASFPARATSQVACGFPDYALLRDVGIKWHLARPHRSKGVGASAAVRRVK
jgi:hypothetical protein